MVITRFAPSPTGYLHVGGARTALYSYLYAKKHQGKFILRIEDTDQERSTQEAVDIILQGLQWLGLCWDEEPVYQTNRMARYYEVIEQLIEKGHAYRCYLTKEELDAMREQQIQRKEKQRYNGYSRELNLADSGEPHVVRFKNPLSGIVTFTDEILGEVSISNEEMDDFIILRSDGMPTYNFAVVVDDSDMGVTHVIRGNDHLTNAARQINCFRALDLEPPRYAHIPIIAGEDGKKLSKRHGAVSVLQYREKGYFPQALLNYLVRLGWSCGDEEIFSLADMTNKFDLAAVQKSPAVFSEDKLNWLNQHYLKTLAMDDIIPEILWHCRQSRIDTSLGPALEDVVEAYRERAVTLVELTEKIACYYQELSAYEQTAVDKFITKNSPSLLTVVKQALQALASWQVDSLKLLIKDVVKQQCVKFPHVAQPLRIALTGNVVSPAIDQTLYLMGKEKAIHRIDNLLMWIEQNPVL